MPLDSDNQVFNTDEGNRGTDLPDGFDSRTYGRSFADVYDEWYPADLSTEAAVSYVKTLCPVGARVLELGIGTGRLAIPLALAGYRVSGIDSSPEMLKLLALKAASASVDIAVSCGDVSDSSCWPDGTFDLVIGAFNFMFNIIGEETKAAVFANAGRHMDPGAWFVIESSVPIEAHESTERRLEVRSVSADSVVLIASSTDHQSGLVTGQHIELRDGEPVRLRPWQVHMSTPQKLDELALGAGLKLVDRRGNWDQAEFSGESLRFIARYGA